MIVGGDEYHDLRGEVLFCQKRCAVIITVRIFGLPENDSGFFAFHIHEGDSCEGDHFSETGNHYNPKENPHPEHAGDLPPLLSCKGSAYMQVKTDRFTVREIIGRTIVIHGSFDDFKTQPSGNAGEKIACGVIQSVALNGCF